MICVNNHRQQLPQNQSEPHSSAIAQLAQFRQELKNSFTHRPDAIMSLLDSLASNTAAKSVAELSLNALFGHQYSSVYDAIDSFFTPSSAKMAADERREKDRQLMRIITPHLSTPKQHPNNTQTTPKQHPNNTLSGFSAWMSLQYRVPLPILWLIEPAFISPTPLHPINRLPMDTSMLP